MKAKNTEIHQKKILNVNGGQLDFSVPKVMGIINLTPDSFYQPKWKDFGYLPSENQMLIQAEKMLDEGADLLDLGAYSSRPNAEHLSVQEEINRLLGPLRSIKKTFPEAIISVDTFRSDVARAAIGEGAAIINDISAGKLDPEMFETIASLNVPYILMHMKGTPQTMQQLVQYENVFDEVYFYFTERLAKLKSLGINELIIDPGFGFAKTTEQNYVLLDKLDQFKSLGLPLLAGLSRKSMVYKTLETDAEGALNGTISANTIALMKGASILRVHDVKPAIDAIKIVQQLD
jgi:dihydropteroate synthase